MNVVMIIGIGIVVLFLLFFIISVLTGMSEKGMTKSLSRMARIQNNFINENEEILKDTANKTANINKDAIKTMVHSAKEGWTDDDKLYCKNCGTPIDEDSNFCKKCGKQI